MVGGAGDIGGLGDGGGVGDSGGVGDGGGVWWWVALHAMMYPTLPPLHALLCSWGSEVGCCGSTSNAHTSRSDID